MHQCFTNHLHSAHDCHSVSNPEQIKVTHVKLNLLADFENEQLSGIATLSLERAVDCPQGAPLVLDTKGLAVSEVTYVGPHVSSGVAPFHFGHPDPILGTPLIIKLPEDALEVIIQYKTTKDSQALQWLPKTATREKFLFTQSQAILARTWVPLQDSPAVRITYEAVIEAPAGFTALMSAEQKPTGRPNLFRFSMPHSIPPYLLALAVGKLAFAKVGRRTGVWAEPHVLKKAAAEFHDMEKMLEALEKLVGPYPWGRWDALILPLSFPFGGMENPCLTFVTPTLLAGDRSLVSVLVHELAHAKSGNEVTNATAADFFLNEGWTVYLERRLLEILYGRERAAMESVLGREALLAELKKLPPSDQILHIDLSGRDPDDGMTDVPYEKGYLFLLTLEKTFGRRVFDRFMRGYFKHFSFQSITTAQFEEYLGVHLLSTNELAAAKIDVRQWLHEPGLPKHSQLHSKRFIEVSRAARSFKSARETSTIGSQDWSTHAWLRFLNALSGATAAQMEQLDRQFHFSATGNSEVLHQWLMMSVRCGYKAARPVLEEFLKTVGRRKFVLPLFEEMVKTEEGKKQAHALFERVRSSYHPIVQRDVAALFAVKDSTQD
jgi:aminopeptidase N